jgi:hypothetical protein
MNARQRINELLADWTAFPIEINDRGVAVLGNIMGTWCVSTLMGAVIS